MDLKQIKFLRTGLPFVVLAVLGLSSCANDLELVQSINEEYSDIESIYIESGFLDFTYDGDPTATTVKLDAILESNKPGKSVINYEVIDGRLNVKLDSKGSSGNSRGYIHLTGPVLKGMEVDGGSGNGRITNIESKNISVSQGSGNLEIKSIIADETLLRLTSGNISGSYLNSDLNVSLSSGNIKLSEVVGNVNAQGSSGKFEFTNIEGLINSQMSSGNIILNSVSELGKLQTSSGNVTAKNSGLGSESDFRASSGNVKINTFSNLKDFNYDIDAGSGNIKVGESSSKGSLKISNGSPNTVIGKISSGNFEISN